MARTVGRCGGHGVQGKGGDGQAGGADRDDAEFHGRGRRAGRQQRAEADAEGGGQEEIAALLLTEARAWHAVGDQVELAKAPTNRK